MARIRTIKPEFFMSEDIGELTVKTRLLYVALWCQADREGIGKFSPTALAAQCMPYEFSDFQACFTELQKNGHVVVYEAENKKYFYLPTFTEHQRPHHTEKESGFPEFNRELTVNEPFVNRKEREREREREGEQEREGERERNIMSGKPDETDAKSIVDYLNEKTGKHFRHCDSNLKLVKARFREGHSEHDLKNVIDLKCSQWGNDEKYFEYLRPATLFNKEKFNQYIGEVGVTPPQAKNGADEWLEEQLAQDNVIPGEFTREA